MPGCPTPCLSIILRLRAWGCLHNQSSAAATRGHALGRLKGAYSLSSAEASPLEPARPSGLHASVAVPVLSCNMADVDAVSFPACDMPPVLGKPEQRLITEDPGNGQRRRSLCAPCKAYLAAPCHCPQEVDSRGHAVWWGLCSEYIQLSPVTPLAACSGGPATPLPPGLDTIYLQALCRLPG